MSRTRLLSSYCSIAVILVVGGALMFTALPLTGEAEIRRVATQAEPRPATQTPPGFVVNRRPLSYPLEALQKRIEGTVVVELMFNSRGEIIDTRVISGPEELRQAALQTVVQGKYAIDVARSLQVLVEFKLPAPGQGVLGGVRGDGRGAVFPPPAFPPPPAAPPDPNQIGFDTPQNRLRVGGQAMKAQLITEVPPVYPPLAAQARLQGVVILEAVVNKDGRVEAENLKIVSGHPLLVPAAIEAVKQYVYRPVMLNGQPTEVQTTITVTIRQN